MLNLRHNVMSILYTIKGMTASHLAQVDEDRFEDDRVRLRHAEKILKKANYQAEQALQMTKRIGQAFHGREKEEEIYAASCVSVKKTWQSLSELLRKEFFMHAVEVIDRIPDNFPEILCDADDFKAVLYHLARNSLQAMKGRRGKLIVRAQLAFSQKEDPYAMITVADTGPGIREPDLLKLFTPFFTTKSEGKGNGLGLYYARRLVTRNRGKIGVSSYAGVGTTFMLEFPARSSVKKDTVHRIQ